MSIRERMERDKRRLELESLVLDSLPEGCPEPTIIVATGNTIRVKFEPVDTEEEAERVKGLFNVVPAYYSVGTFKSIGRQVQKNSQLVGRVTGDWYVRIETSEERPYHSYEKRPFLWDSPPVRWRYRTANPKPFRKTMREQRYISDVRLVFFAELDELKIDVHLPINYLPEKGSHEVRYSTYDIMRFDIKEDGDGVRY